MRLDEFKSDTYSQFGEDGMIARIFDAIGRETTVCVDFGAGDGSSCSNTKLLWRDHGWTALLIEPDDGRFESLEGEAHGFRATCLRTMVESTGSNSISELVAAVGLGDVDFLSIDIDGDDYFMFENLTIRPRVICIEFNPTIPPHLAVHQAQANGTFGASLLALVQLAASKGYTFVGASRCNGFFVRSDLAGHFEEFDTDLQGLFLPGDYTYAVTDYYGRIVLVGQVLPWEAKDPYVQPLESATYVTMPTNSVQQIRRGFESIWGPSTWLTPNGLSPEIFERILRTRARPLVCIDLSSAVRDSVQWMWEAAANEGYQALFVGKVLGLHP